MISFDLRGSKNIALVASLAVASTTFALHQAAGATPGKVLRDPQAAAQAAPQVPNNVTSMPVPQLGFMPPELQAHSIDPIPENGRPLPKVVEGSIGREDPRTLRDIIDESAAPAIKSQQGPIALDYGFVIKTPCFTIRTALST